MSRKSRKSRRKKRTAPQSTGRQQPRKPAEELVAAPESAADEPAAAPVARKAAGDENLSETYAHVSRDLKRIVLLAVLMFAIIFISPYIL